MSHIEKEIVRSIRTLGLPDSVLQTTMLWWVPLAQDLVTIHQNRSVHKPMFIGLQGAPSSGVTSTAMLLKQSIEVCSDLRVLVLSLSDFCLPQRLRTPIAQNIHALFMQPGIPGTHDTLFLTQIMACIRHQESFLMPKFETLLDDWLPQTDWRLVEFNQPVDIVLVEGWCVGLPSQSEAQLSEPVNDLESIDDTAQQWRRHVNYRLATDYLNVFQGFDYLIYLNPPSFTAIRHWYQLQAQHSFRTFEKRQISHSPAAKITMNHQEQQRYIAHFERLCRFAADVMPARASWVFDLSENMDVLRRVDRLSLKALLQENQ